MSVVKRKIETGIVNIRILRVVVDMMTLTSYSLNWKYKDRTLGKRLLKRREKKELLFSINVGSDETTIHFELESGKKLKMGWNFDFKGLCRNYIHRRQFGVEGLKIQMWVTLENFGPNPEDVFPSYKIFSERYTGLNIILFNILEFLPSQELVKRIALVSRYLQKTVTEFAKFLEPVGIKRCTIVDIHELRKRYKNCDRFHIEELLPQKYLKNLQKLDFSGIRQLQFSNILFDTNKKKVVFIHRVILNMPNLDFLNLNISHSTERDNPNNDDEETPTDFPSIKYEEFVFPIQSDNKKVEAILRGKREAFVGKKTGKIRFVARPNEAILNIIHGFLFAIDFSSDKKSVILYNDTEDTVVDIFCRLLLEKAESNDDDSDCIKNTFHIPILYTRDFLSPDEFRPFEHDDLIFFWKEGVCDAMLQIRFFGSLITPDEYKEILGRGNPGTYDEIEKKVKVGEKVRTEVTVTPEEFNDDFDEKSLVTKEVVIVGLKWTIEIIGFSNDTYVHLYVSPNMHGQTPLHYEGVVIFHIDGKWYHSHRNSEICSSGGIECGADISKDLTIAVFVQIDRIWRNEFADVLITGDGGRDEQQILLQPVGKSETREVEINNFYDFSQYYLDMLQLGWIFTIAKEESKGRRGGVGQNYDTMNVAVERGFGIDVITPVIFLVELLSGGGEEEKNKKKKKNVQWKIESILCFYTFKGQFYRYGKLPLKPFLGLIGGEKYRIRLTLRIGEAITTKEEYSASLQKIVHVSKKYVNQKFSEDFEIVVPDDNLVTKLPFIARYFDFADIRYSCEFSPSRNGYVSLTLSHRLPFQSSLMNKEFVLTLLDDDEGSSNKKKKVTRVRTEDSFIDFDRICKSDMKKKVWKFRISMFVKKVTKENFTLRRRIQKKEEEDER